MFVLFTPVLPPLTSKRHFWLCLLSPPSSGTRMSSRDVLHAGQGSQSRSGRLGPCLLSLPWMTCRHQCRPGSSLPNIATPIGFLSQPSPSELWKAVQVSVSTARTIVLREHSPSPPWRGRGGRARRGSRSAWRRQLSWRSL
jgi:hypothetical protein